MNKEKLKSDIKETVQILGLALAGGVVVFHINSFFKPSSDAAPQKIETVMEKVDTIAANMRDSIAVRAPLEKTR